MINRLSNGAVASRPAEADSAGEETPSESTASVLWGRVQEAVMENPKTSLAAALAAGVLLGWIIKRR